MVPLSNSLQLNSVRVPALPYPNLDSPIGGSWEWFLKRDIEEDLDFWYWKWLCQQVTPGPLWLPPGIVRGPRLREANMTWMAERETQGAVSLRLL